MKNIYTKLFVASIIIFVVILFRKAIPVLLFPEATTAELIEYKYSYFKGRGAYGRENKILVATPVYSYKVKDKYYTIELVGDLTQHNQTVDIVYSRVFPMFAVPASLLGSMDAKTIAYGGPLLILATGIFFALSGQKLFVISSSFTFPKFLLVSTYITLSPMLLWVDYLLLGKVVPGTVTLNTTSRDGFLRNIIVYKFRDKSYKIIGAPHWNIHAPGTNVKIWVKKHLPKSGVEISIRTFYSDGVIAYVTIGLIAAYVWYNLSSKVVEFKDT